MRPNVNCVEYMGQNAPQLAIGNEHLKVTELLLESENLAHIGDALLLTISKGYVQIDEDGTRFSPDIAPIILAAHCQKYKVVHMLLMKGARIKWAKLFLQVQGMHREAKARLLQPLTLEDRCLQGPGQPGVPLLVQQGLGAHSCRAQQCAGQLAKIEEFKNDCRKLSMQCKDFVVGVLDLCQDSQEIEAILNGDLKSAEPLEQQLLMIWYENLSGLRRQIIAIKCLMLVMALGLPFLAISYWITPCSRINKKSVS
ncbi:hypothetical protein P7K49_022344 [Saguinus oedipus]|uniref:Uncharacterized protein n=1 Tax=Saguinus oedipus TaxID=9490 RepID=A0ABQ9UVC3_SAGOE|nr:hypothetical protein P7K49_022344 [Saguinus oedipus]